MQKITPFLWFEKDMNAVVDYYASIFPDVSTSSSGELENTPSGTVQMKSISIFGTRFDLMTAGPYLSFNPTVSFIISCESQDEAQDLWNKIIKEGKELMPMQSYDFAPMFGWAQDKYGVSWQIMYMNGEKPTNLPVQVGKIVSTLMFCGDVCGRAEEAMNFYVSIFPNSHVDYSSPYDGSEPVDDDRAKTKHAGFTLDGTRFSVLDSGRKSPLTFQQAISFVVYCDNQKEIDYYWEKLTDGGAEVQCGWLNDKFGVPWQIVPKRMTEMMSTGTPEQIARVTEAFMKMKKFDIQTLEEAYEGK
jgi:predicted 3-demethylubiquinone-9 3-methyltransferase (glyoxalase superfamily)